jgi:predicted Zn-dependent protease
VSAPRPGAGQPETDGLVLAERVLDLVRARAASAEAEVNVRTGTFALTRFANGAIHQNVAEELREIGVRVALDGHVAAARLDGPAGDDELRHMVAGVFEAAAVSPVDDDWPGLASPTPSPDVDHWDDATGAATPDERATLVADFVGAADGLVTAGAVSTAAFHAAFANTAGQAVTGRGTSADIDGIGRTGTSDGVARQSSVRVADIDAAAAGRRAAQKARDGAEPGDLEPGRYEVVLEPSCVADIVDFVLVHGFGGRAVNEGRSFVRPGEAQLDPSITLRQDVADARLAGLAFDAEGTPRKAMDLVRAGVTGSVLHDRRTARTAGAESTGNAALGPNPYGGVPASLILESGSTDPADMIASVERGLLVTDFWYTRVLDPKTLVITGLTRNGVWLIENGQVVRPVRNLRFTQGYAQALGPGNVKAIGNDPTLFSHGPDDQLLVPSLHLASWAFTGGAKG